MIRRLLLRLARPLRQYHDAVWVDVVHYPSGRKLGRYIVPLTDNSEIHVEAGYVVAGAYYVGSLEEKVSQSES